MTDHSCRPDPDYDGLCWCAWLDRYEAEIAALCAAIIQNLANNRSRSGILPPDNHGEISAA